MSGPTAPVGEGRARISQLLIEIPAAGTATAERLRRWARAQGIQVREVPAKQEDRAAAGLAVGSSKQTLRVVRQAGAVLKPCTGRTDSLLCCNLHVVTQTVGCPLDCSYCILQGYQNRDQIVVRADPADVLDQLAEELACQPRRLFRVCTGQVADSLALEPEVGFSAPAVEAVAMLENAVLELKTKTDRVGFLEGLRHGGRTLVSWTLSPPEVARAEEHGAASTEARLAAAARMVKAGYLVAFHLDPMIAPDGDPRPYQALVQKIAAAVPAERVAALSMGTVRFQPAMRRTILSRFPRSRVTLAELLPDVDGKLRQLAPTRVALYQAVAAEARRCLPGVFLYLCMEPARVWRRALGVDLPDRQAVELAMARSFHERFGLAPCAPTAADYPPQGPGIKTTMDPLDPDVV